MPVYKNKERNTWYCSFYYQDWTGKRKKKKKEGFATKREAQAFERNFLSEYAGMPDITFETLVKAYLDKARLRVKASTLANVTIIWISCSPLPSLFFYYIISIFYRKNNGLLLC